MSRVINPNSVGKTRTKMVKAVVIAIREMMGQGIVDARTKDLAAFIVLGLETISETIDPSVEAWEKRGYWVKADRFRMEWNWSNKYARLMKEALLEENWPSVAEQAVGVASKLGNVKVSTRHRMGTPWVGAWSRLLAKIESDEGKKAR